MSTSRARAVRWAVAAGAEAIVLATNTMHIVADRITAAIDVPFLHIGDVTADAIRSAGIDTVALLGRHRDRTELVITRVAHGASSVGVEAPILGAGWTGGQVDGAGCNLSRECPELG